MIIETFDLNNYVLPKIVVNSTTKYILNGVNNSFFTYIKERYNGSPTNAGVINNYVNYIIGQGLIDKNGINVKQYISKRDLTLFCQDYVMYGQFTPQILWSKGLKAMKNVEAIAPKPLLIKYTPTEKIGLNQNNQGEIDGYWYSFDWVQNGTYKPVLYPKFDGVYKDVSNEMITISRISSEPYFAQPQYISGLQYAHLEEELSNGAINHVLNGFCDGKIINVIGGIPATEELKSIYTSQILNKLTGSTNRNKTIVSFTDNIEGGEIKVENIEPTQFDEVFTNFTDLAERKIFAAHSVTNPILFGIRDGSGLGSNKDEMKEALKNLYRSNINPMREIIIDGLESILKFIEPTIQLEFKDFEELTIQDAEQNNAPE